MQFSVTFRHMEATESLKSYAHERLQKIKKYFPDPIACHVVLSTERHHHRVDVSVQLHNGFHIAGHETTENMYSSIDLVSAKIERQVRRYKDRLRQHKVRELTPVPILHTVLGEAPESTADDGAAPEPAPVVRTTRIEAIAMSADEAIMQLNLAHQAFLVFRNEATGNIAVIYRRSEEGAYGLIDTGEAT